MRGWRMLLSGREPFANPRRKLAASNLIVLVFMTYEAMFGNFASTGTIRRGNGTLFEALLTTAESQMIGQLMPVSGLQTSAAANSDSEWCLYGMQLEYGISTIVASGHVKFPGESAEQTGRRQAAGHT